MCVDEPRGWILIFSAARCSFISYVLCIWVCVQSENAGNSKKSMLVPIRGAFSTSFATGSPFCFLSLAKGFAFGGNFCFATNGCRHWLRQVFFTGEKGSLKAHSFFLETFILWCKTRRYFVFFLYLKMYTSIQFDTLKICLKSHLLRRLFPLTYGWIELIFDYFADMNLVFFLFYL